MAGTQFLTPSQSPIIMRQVPHKVYLEEIKNKPLETELAGCMNGPIRKFLTFVVSFADHSFHYHLRLIYTEEKIGGPEEWQKQMRSEDFFYHDFDEAVKAYNDVGARNP